jgi:ribosomal-protein-alanine N-acetyltransferase
VSSALLTFGFDTLKLQRVVGSTASGNDRVTKLARWFGAREGTVGEGSAWMRARGWREVEWVIDRADWLASAWHRRGRPADV